MKRISGVYNSIISLENLSIADKLARKGKLNTYGVKQHIKNCENNLLKLHQDLKEGNFKTSSYKKFKIYEGKERTIAKLPYYPDRIVQWAIINKIGDVFIKTFTKDTYNCIKGRGIHKASENLRKALKDKQNTKYCLKLDIRKFYNNINHEILKQLLRKKFKDEKLLALLDGIIDSYDEGLPLGSLLSQFLANFYLCYFDHHIKEQMRVRYYYRYCDDIVILSGDKEELHKIFAEIKIKLSELKLEIKSNHQIFPVDVRGIDFVGYVHRKDYTLLRKKIKINYIKSKNKQNWNGWLKHCNSVNLRRKYERNEN